MPDIISLMVAICGHFLAWTYLLGWFFSANWFDALQKEGSGENELGISGAEVANFLMGLLIVLSIGDIISLVNNGIDNKFHDMYVGITSGYMALLVLAGIMTIREYIRERRGK